MATEQLLWSILGLGDVNPTVHFLPASRGGVTQAERVMGIAMMRIGGRAGGGDIPPTLSRTVVDYLADLRMFLDGAHKMQEEQAAISRHSKGRPGSERVAVSDAGPRLPPGDYPGDRGN